jgi:hypothetical protein
LLVSASSLFAQKHDLTEDKLVDSCYQVSVAMQIDNGKIVIQRDGMKQTIARKAAARHVYVERILDAKDGIGTRGVRLYKEAWAEIDDGGQKIKLALGAGQALAVAQRFKDNIVVYDPAKAMSREEMEVTEHFDSLAVSGLVPGKEYVVGEKWTIANAPAQALCYLDGLVASNITAQLDSVSDAMAKVTLAGNVTGIDKGSQVVLFVQGHYLFDLKSKRLVELLWTQSDQRTQGPVSPEMSADVKITLKRTPINEPESLSNAALRGVLGEPMTAIRFAQMSKTGRFEFKHSRDWHVVREDKEVVVLRLLDRGDLVAQCAITTLKNTNVAQMNLQAFESTMASSLGWAQEKVIGTPKEEKTKEGATIYRVTAQGKLTGLEAVQSFYLVVGENGDHRVATFTMLPNQVQKLEGRDQALIESFRFAPAGMAGN